MKKQQIVEVKSAINDNVIMSFEVRDEGTNVITAGFKKICDMLKIDRVQAESRYYVTQK